MVSVRNFIVANIYLLLLINCIILFLIYFKVIKNKFKERKYKREYETLEVVLTDYVQNGENLEKVQMQLVGNFSKEVAIDILVNYSQNNNAKINDKFKELGLHNIITRKAQNHINQKNLKNLVFMKDEGSYDILFKYASAHDYSIKYMSLCGLSFLHLLSEERQEVFKKVIESKIIRDRMIEIVNNLNLTISECLELLEKQNTNTGKVVLLRVISDKEQTLKKEQGDKIIKYLKEEKEVRISTVILLCSTKDTKYIPLMESLYKSDDQWEVRSTIAKYLKKFPLEFIEKSIRKMAYDEAWWVRYNALETLVSKGIEGVNAILDIYLEGKDRNVADLAYYFLNANKDIYESVIDVVK